MCDSVWLGAVRCLGGGRRAADLQQVVFDMVDLQGGVAESVGLREGLLHVDAGGVAVQVGRTVPLSPAQSATVAEIVRPAGPDHPWPDEIGAGRWGRSGAKVALIKVEPTVVVEVSADAALHAGQWRHGLRFIRPRPDLVRADVPTVQ